MGGRYKEGHALFRFPADQGKFDPVNVRLKYDTTFDETGILGRPAVVITLREFVQAVNEIIAQFDVP